MTVRTSTRTLGPLCAPLALAVCAALGAGCQNSTPEPANQTQEQTQVQPQTPVESQTQAQVPVTTDGQQVPVVQDQNTVQLQTQTPPQAPVQQQQVQAVQPRTVQPKSTPKVETKVPAPVAVVPQPAVLAVGTSLSGTLQSTVASDKSNVGDAVVVNLTEPVLVEGRTVVPVGSSIRGTVTHVRAAGRVKGASEVTVRFTDLVLANGKALPITCEPFRRVVKGDGKETAAEIGGATAVGGILGGVLGGKDGAVKGAVLGGAVGTGVAVGTKGDQIVLPAGHRIEVTLTAPVTVEN